MSMKLYYWLQVEIKNKKDKSTILNKKSSFSTNLVLTQNHVPKII
jgi:hypothetical protein